MDRGGAKAAAAWIVALVGCSTRVGGGGTLRASANPYRGGLCARPLRSWRQRCAMLSTQEARKLHAFTQQHDTIT
jgi:hypothetical protein